MVTGRGMVAVLAGEWFTERIQKIDKSRCSRDGGQRKPRKPGSPRSSEARVFRVSLRVSALARWFGQFSRYLGDRSSEIYSLCSFARRTNAERATVARVPDVQRRTSPGASQDQASHSLGESRVQARPSLPASSYGPDEPKKHYPLGIQGTLRQHDAPAWKGNPCVPRLPIVAPFAPCR